MTKKLKCPEGGTAYKTPGGDPIFSDPEFKSLLDPLSPAELGTLEANIIADKRALDPIVVWQELRIILDGHNRIDICAARKLPYKIVFIKFPDTSDGRTAALQWVIEHQLGRRNVSADAKAKLVEWRRERVAKASSEGKSNRTIAKEENVSTATIANDLEKAGANPFAPAKVTGADGKQYPSKAERLGLGYVAPPPKVAGRDAGDDTDSEAADAKARKTEPKPGKLKFDWAPFESTFAKMMLFPDLIGKAYGAHNSPEAKALRSEMMAWKKRFKEWAKTIAKTRPPMEYHEES